MTSSVSKKKEEELDKIINKSKALKSFIRYYSGLTVEEKELLVANKDLYASFFRGSASIPTTGAIKVSSDYFKILTEKYKL